MLKKTGPNAVESTDGFSVRRVDRTHVEYREGDLVGQMEVEGVLPPGGGAYYVALYPKTLVAHQEGGGHRSISDDKRQQILDRIVDAHKVLGVPVTVE